jgi:uncharacterized protein (TIGR00290 family)
MRKVAVSWSGGKDSMLALHRLLADPEVEVSGLMAAFRGPEAVISLHNTPRSLIEAQAEALALPLYPVQLSANAPNTEYEQQHQACFAQLKADGIPEVAFGDIHLAPIKAYRDQLLSNSDMKGFYPLWQADPQALVREFVGLGYQSMITAIDLLAVPPAILGQTLSLSVVDELIQQKADACGENGEYHSLVYDGPAFRHPVGLTQTGTTEADYRPTINMHLRAFQLAATSAKEA